MKFKNEFHSSTDTNWRVKVNNINTYCPKYFEQLYNSTLYTLISQYLKYFPV